MAVDAATKRSCSAFLGCGVTEKVGSPVTIGKGKGDSGAASYAEFPRNQKLNIGVAAGWCAKQAAGGRNTSYADLISRRTNRSTGSCVACVSRAKSVDRMYPAGKGRQKTPRRRHNTGGSAFTEHHTL